MNKIRQIIAERLENYRKRHFDNYPILSRNDMILGQIEAYQDCLNLIPAPRTETDILNDFEKLGWYVAENDNSQITMTWRVPNTIGYFILNIFKSTKTYKKMCVVKGESFPADIDMQEHKLLNELFTIWEWI